MTLAPRLCRPPLYRAALLLLPALLVLGCDDSPSEPRGPLSFTTVVKTSQVHHVGPQLREVVRDAATFASIWGQLHGPASPPLPAVDFRREMVVVATASLSCFGDVTIEGIERLGSGLEVRIADAQPAPLCLCFAADYVFHVVRATRVEGPASFTVRPVAPRCG